MTNMRDLIRSLGLFPLTDRQILTVQEFESLIAAACDELADVDARPYIRLYVDNNCMRVYANVGGRHTIYGMKP